MNERLLTETERYEALQHYDWQYRVLVAQDAKTAAAKDEEWREHLQKVIADLTKDGVCLVCGNQEQPGIEPPSGVPEDQLPTPAEIRGIGLEKAQPNVGGSGTEACKPLA